MTYWCVLMELYGTEESALSGLGYAHNTSQDHFIVGFDLHMRFAGNQKNVEYHQTFKAKFCYYTIL